MNVLEVIGFVVVAVVCIAAVMWAAGMLRVSVSVKDDE